MQPETNTQWINLMASTLPLDGSWEFNLGHEGSDWTTIQVPACWEAQGHDAFIDGPARYRRQVFIPSDWAGQRIELDCEAVSYACEIFCNGLYAGSHEGMWTPFALDLTGAIRPGQENLIEFVIYKPGKRYPLRASLAGFLPDVATSFGGIWQPISLRAMAAGLYNVRIKPDLATAAIRVQACLVETKARAQDCLWHISLTGPDQDEVIFEIPGITSEPLDETVSPGQVLPWSPEQPDLYMVEINCLVEGKAIANTRKRVGFRRFSALGDQVMLNDQPFMVRGILSWGWDPNTIAPYQNLETARAEMQRVRAMGFNLIKLCLFVPNQAYLDAADEEGMLLWQELPMWLPEVTPSLRSRAPQEYQEITDLVAHHPSVVMYSLGCELNRTVDHPFLSQLNESVRSRIQDVLLCDNSGSGESYGGLDSDFSDFTDYHPYYDMQYFEPLLDHWRRDWQSTRPWIFGEFNDSDSFRNQDELTLANGERPWWLTHHNPVTTWRSEARAAVEWCERLQQANPGFSLDEMMRISHQQSLVIRKHALEALRRRRGMGGYVVTGLRDTPISTSGVWDDLLRPKWHEQEFLPFNSDDVLCLDVARRRRWHHGGDRPDPIDPYCWWAGSPVRWEVILHASRHDYQAGQQLLWIITTQDGQSVARGEALVETSARAGIPTRVATIHWQAPDLVQARGYHLRISLAPNGYRQVTNQWPFWIYPRLGRLPKTLAIYDPPGLLDDFGDQLKPVVRLTPENRPQEIDMLITTQLDSSTWDFILKGHKVLLLQQGEGPLPARRCPFWREAIKLFVNHPLWQRFPHQGFSDMQFFAIAGDLAFDTGSLVKTLPGEADIQPIFRRLDAREFHISEYLFEVRLGKGSLLGCTLHLQGGSGAQPVGLNRNVAGAAMLEAMIAYLDRST